MESKGLAQPGSANEGGGVLDEIARSPVHRCGNCIMWSLAPGADMGVCEAHSNEAGTPHTFRPGMGLRAPNGEWQTTNDSSCDYQVPIPPPGPPCPKCGADLHEGYGLMGGGIGAYEVCLADGCDYFTKWPDPELSTAEELSSSAEQAATSGPGSPPTDPPSHTADPDLSPAQERDPLG